MPTLTAGKTDNNSQQGAPPYEKNLLLPYKTSSLPFSSRQIVVTIMHFSHGGAKSGSELEEDREEGNVAGQRGGEALSERVYFKVAPFTLSRLCL